MAVIQHTIELDTSVPTYRNYVVSWKNLAGTDSGTPVSIGEYYDRSVQISGTFGGATVTIEGSNDGVSYFPLTDPQGNAISKTTGGIEQIMELTRFVRPVVTGGTGSNINVFMYVRGQR